ncbi:MAG: hypothetical protein GXP18_05255 [Gammaproteobacteria bacterium]|nr:hypothetical protein [Gammaproteobacteria bacterium]
MMYSLKPQIQLSLAMHDIAGIDTQIHHNLLQLHRLHVDADRYVIRQ